MRVRELIEILENLEDKDMEIMAINAECNYCVKPLDVYFREESMWNQMGDGHKRVYIMYGEY